MLGVFQPDHPTRVPERAVAFVADQLDVDPGRLEEYRTRAQTAYEHAWQIRDTFGYREFAAGEEDLRAYLAARVWAGEEGPKALFDRSVLYLLEHQTLLPGLTVLSRLVSGVRKAENALLHQVVAKRIPHPVRAEPGTLLQIPDQARFSELERLRTEPDRVSSPGLLQALDRTARSPGSAPGKCRWTTSPGQAGDAGPTAGRPRCWPPSATWRPHRWTRPWTCSSTPRRPPAVGWSRCRRCGTPSRRWCRARS